MRILRVEHAGEAHFATWAVGSADISGGDGSTLCLMNGAPWLGGSVTDQHVELADVRLLAPVSPSKVVCVGRNYAAHAKELGNDVPKEPLLFLKPPSALCATGDVIVRPDMSERVEHEAEVGIVIGKRLKNASVEQALSGIFGVTCVNDVTARDLQKRDTQFTRAKSFDTFCPVGPWIETELELTKLEVITRVNGQVRQHGNTRDMVFPIVQLIAFMSRVMTLEPGDLIATGTPEGVGPIVAGDTVEIEVSGVGVLKNAVG